MPSITEDPAARKGTPEPPSDLRVVVINDASNARGGATGLALALMLTLRSRAIPVTFLCGDSGEAPDLERAGVEIVPLDGRHILNQSTRSALVNGLYNRAAEQHVARWISTHDTPTTVYHLHGWSKILSPSVFRALRPVAARLIVHAHDFFLACPNGGYANFQTQTPCPLRPLSLNCLASNCDKRSYPEKLWRVARHGLRNALFNFDRERTRIAAIHEAMSEGLTRAGLPAARIVSIRNPATPFISTRVAAEENREVMFVGRLFREKGADLAAAACARAGVPFTVIGEGEDEARVRAANDATRFLGWQTRGAIEGLVARARLVVMPSRYPEPFGLIALEALMSGIPVVLSPSALLANDIVRMGMGRSVDPFDTAAFADVLGGLAGDDAAIRSMSERAYAGASDLCLSLDKWVSRHLDLYREQLSFTN